MPFRKWDQVMEMMDYTDLIDPNNRRTTGLRGYITRVRALTADVERLEAKRREKKMDDQDAFTLAHDYFEMGRIMEAAQLARTVADRVSDAAALQALAQIFTEAHADADAEKALNRYLQAKPKDANAWGDLAKLQYRGGRTQAAQQSFIRGYQIDAQTLFDRLRRDKELQDLAMPLFQKRQ